MGSELALVGYTGIGHTEIRLLNKQRQRWLTSID